ncbi:MAG: YciI family protein [Alphaproteobacteria bacterium]|nr:YciI family protein [Alphaproteobacteria bacterium]
MAQYAIYCTDSADGSALRQRHMPAHLEHIGRVKSQLLMAGPCPATEGQTREASLLVVEADSAAAARRLLESDPFYKAGVWETIVVRPFRAVVGAWVPDPVR